LASKAFLTSVLVSGQSVLRNRIIYKVLPSLQSGLNLQKEIEKKAIRHGIGAFLLAILLTAVCYNLGFQPGVPPAEEPIFSQLGTFASYEELENFIRANMERATQFANVYGGLLYDSTVRFLAPEALAMSDYSTTNVQVAGVDESDIVKTDGEYLYVVSGPYVYILKAYPPDQARVLSKIGLDETYGTEIYVSGNRLVILGNKYQFIVYNDFDFVYPYLGEVFISVYDVSDRAKPILTRTVILNGTLTGSRMIGDYVYAVVNQPATFPSYDETDFQVILPRIYTGSSVKEVQPTEISYVNVSDVYYYFTTVFAVNIIDDAEEPTYETFMTGATACMYVSLSNMYLAVPNTTAWILPEKAGETREETLIYRVKFDREKVTCEAEGSVSGYVLNQFSMDEYNGFFRITTTKWVDNTSQNSLFILDMGMEIVGRLKNLAPGERIYSARFMGERCYLVTFEQVDPFFVIDVGNPAEPRVLGYLKIPGFSGYLHPYDEDHVIGIGKQDNNLKLSLFDVTNVNAPIERAKYLVQGDWSDSAALWDHKALLFDKSKQLLALPVSIWWTSVENDTYYVEGYWQGAYVLDISLEGFTLEGRISHLNATDPYDFGFEVRRVLYIDNVLYTVSDKIVQLHDLESLELMNELKPS